jgi:hypothetical protein
MANSRRLGLLVFSVAAAASLVPLLIFQYFPSSDGGAHVMNASLLDRLIFEHDAQVSAWYRMNPVVVPNWLGHILLMALVPFVPASMAERILIGFYVLTFLFGFRYMLRGVTRETNGLEFLAFPLVYNMHVYWGFYNFCLSLVILLFLIGFVVRSQDVLNTRRLVMLAVLALLSYLSHGLMFFFGFMSALVLLVLRGSAGAGADLSQVVRFTRPHIYRKQLLTAGKAFVAFVPALILFAYYSLFRVHGGEGVTEWPTLRYAASLLMTLSPISTFGKVDRVLAALYAVLLYGMALFGLWLYRQKWRMPELLLLASLGMVAVFLLPVTMSGGTMATPRLVYFPVIMLVAWLAANPLPRRWCQLALVGSLCIAITAQVLRWSVYVGYDREVGQLAASLHDQLHPNEAYLQIPGATIGPLTNAGNISSPDISGSVLCLLSVANRASVINNYEATVDHFPLLFRPERDPYRTFSANAELKPQEVIKQPFNGVTISGILTWCDKPNRNYCDDQYFFGLYQNVALRGAPPQAQWRTRALPKAAAAITQ